MGRQKRSDEKEYGSFVEKTYLSDAEKDRGIHLASSTCSALGCRMESILDRGTKTRSNTEGSLAQEIIQREKELLGNLVVIERIEQEKERIKHSKN